MPVVSLTIHPNGLHPMEAMKAHFKHTEQGMSLNEIIAEGEVFALTGAVAGRTALHGAIRRVRAMSKRQYAPETKYSNCGRKKVLGKAQEAAIVAFVKRWRNKLFCTCGYIKQELKLDVSKRTVGRVLNEHGYFWRKVPKIAGLGKEQLEQRKAWVETYLNRPPSWWEEHMAMVLDGVTLTIAPKPFSSRQKHSAQRITSVWMRAGETMNNDLHTFNRYGIQLGTKVPLWGGFAGNGVFSLRLWTPKPKMTKEDWARLVPSIRTAVVNAHGGMPGKPWVWQDNERFLQIPAVYKKNGLIPKRFPPNSGDLNPIETVWAWLRKDLAILEHDDLQANRYLTAQQFRQRCARILNSYSVVKTGERRSRLQKLVRGMPKRTVQSKSVRTLRQVI